LLTNKEDISSALNTFSILLYFPLINSIHTSIIGLNERFLSMMFPLYVGSVHLVQTVLYDNDRI